MSLYLIIALYFISLALIIVERRIRDSRLQIVIGGLAVNILAAAVVFTFQVIYEKPWNLTPFFIGGASAVALTLPFIITQHKRQQVKLSEVVDQANTLQAQLEMVLSEKNAALSESNSSQSNVISNSGLIVYARNYVEDFQKITGREFGEYLRGFVTNSASGSTFKMVGIDWTELFGAVVSATSERYMKLLADPKTTFNVILLDPRSSAGLEKRVSEFNLQVDGGPRYIQNHPDRVYGKIVGATKMMAEYHNKFPRQFQYRFTKELPTVCWIMNQEKIIFYLYSRCHKGWDSPVFIAEKTANGVYEFFDQYFDFLWQHPNSCLSKTAWNEQKQKLAPILADFEQALKAGCTGPLHRGCPKL